MAEKQLTNDELLAQFDTLGVDDNKEAPMQASAPSQEKSEQDVLAELENLASPRPATPRVSGTFKRPSTSTPPMEDSKRLGAGVRKSGESQRQSPGSRYQANVTPAETTPSETGGETATESESTSKGADNGDSGGGWWGVFATATATATAAVKQAGEAAMKEIQKNEDAQRWAEQVKGNVGALKGLGNELRTLTVPTFTNLIHTLAPPISSHERLQIHITHDFSGYPALDPLVYSVFSRVMEQVEGGDLMVIQRGQEAAPRRSGTSKDSKASTTGWNDGPWWRTVLPCQPRSISTIKGGTVVATKLARASAESYSTEYYASRGGLEEAARHASQVLSDSNPVRSSDIFLAIQAVSQAEPAELAQTSAASVPAEKDDARGVGGSEADKHQDSQDHQRQNHEEVSFAVYLLDPIHGINLHTLTQSIPQRWVDWLDSPAPESSAEDNNLSDLDYEDEQYPTIPPDVAEMLANGGVDPRDWAAEWLQDVLMLGVGIVAQRYVARRMGVDEGGGVADKDKGNMRAERATTVESGAGEAARAL